MKNKKKMIIAGIALILLVIVGVVAVNISKKDSQREEIARQLELGKKQLTSLEYEEAIATFKNALAIDPKDRELLAGLVEAEEAYANSKVTILLADISSSEEAESYLVQMSEKEAILQEAIEELTKNEVIKDNPGYQEASDKLNSLIEEIQKEKEDAESKKKDFTSDFENQQEEVTEKESALSDEEIIGAIRKASEFAYNWFWISDREHVDEYDTYVEYDENGNITKQGKTNCKINSIEEAVNLFNALGYEKLININDHLLVYANKDDEFVIECVNNKHIYIEIEDKCNYIDKCYKSDEEMKDVINKYNLPLKQNNYYAKKALDELNEI